MRKRNAEIVVFALALAIVLAVGLNTSRFFFRLDLTENKAFTISRVSRQLFQEIPNEVYITYYVSDKLRSLYSFPAQIADLLNEYAAYSRGKIRVTVTDPVTSGELTKAESLGVYPQQIQVVERDQRSYAQVYSGIVIQYLDRFETIPLVFRLESLEYDLTSKIRKTVTNQERVVGLLVGDASRDPQQDFATLSTNLAGDFTVRTIQRGEEIPSEVDALFVLGTQDLDTFDLFPIDQFVMRGGKVLFASEGLRMDLRRGLQATKLENTAALQMLESYGVRVEQKFVLDKYAQNFRIPRQVFGQVMWQIMDKYPFWITVAEQDVSRDNPITARFSGLDLYWASPLQLIARQGVEEQPLVKTTPQGWSMDEPFETSPNRASMLMMTSHDTEGQYTLAAALSGTFDSYFKDRPIPTREGETRDWKKGPSRSPQTRILVVGDADFASEIYQYTEATYNMEFLANAAEWLTSSDDLLEIKTRVARDLRLNRIQDQNARLQAALFTQVITVVIVPLLVIGFGIARFLLRRRKSASRVEEG